MNGREEAYGTEKPTKEYDPWEKAVCPYVGFFFGGMIEFLQSLFEKQRIPGFEHMVEKIEPRGKQRSSQKILL